MHAQPVRRLALALALAAATLPAMAAQPPKESAHVARDAGLGPALATDALAGLRGGDGQVTVEVDNQGAVEGNTASQVVAGDNRIDGGAFANAAGLNTVIQNSGSNVLIQNGTSVNVRFGGP